jgi:single-strand DNA-binding protein
MFNKWIGIGRLTRDPEVKQTQSGLSVCSFTIAVDRPYSKDREKQADFINCVAWRERADFIGKYFEKGKPILVEGSIQTRNYEDKNGSKRTAVEVVADNVRFVESKGSGESSPAPKSADIGYASGPNGQDFTEIEDNSDLPF